MNHSVLIINYHKVIIEMINVVPSQIIQQEMIDLHFVFLPNSIRRILMVLG